MQLTVINDSVMGSVWNKYYKADALREVYFDSNLSFCEDMHFNAKVLDSMCFGDNVMIVSKQLYCYMDNEQSVTHNKDLLFDHNDELKYILALKTIHNDCKLDKKTLALLRMKIACFCIDYMNTDIDIQKKQKLRCDLKRNYIYLLMNLSENNWKWNLKRIYFGFQILLKGN